MEESRAAPYLRALLAFLKEAPGIGWTIKGATNVLEELSAEEDDRALEARFAELLAVGDQTNETVEFVAELAKAIFVQNTVLLQRLISCNDSAE
jgi:hypothetical protein